MLCVVRDAIDCGMLVQAHHSYVVSRNTTWAVYDCQEGYRLHSGHLLRQCVNNTWTGDAPACTVDSVLPKAYLVMLIIGATLSVFVACIPYDFYRFRRRKKAARKHQERLSLMTRIAPGHAKMMTEVVPMETNLAAGQRRFGFRSLIKAFRFVAEKMKTTNGEDPEAGTSSGDHGADGAHAGNNGGLQSGMGSSLHKPGSPVPPHTPTSPKPEERHAARARMSAVLHIWSGGRSFQNRAKSVDITGDHPLLRHHQKRNSLANASATISAAATTAATAAAAATASSAPSSASTPVEEHHRSTSVVCDDTGNRHVVEMTPPAVVDDNPMSNPAPTVFALPKTSSGRMVRLSASIPEDRDEREDGACTGSKFKVTERKGVTSSYSMPSRWPEKVSPSDDFPLVKAVADDKVAALAFPKVKSAAEDKVAALTESNVAAFNEENSLTLSESKITSVSPETRGRIPPPLTREMSIDSDRRSRSDKPMSTSSSVGTDDTDQWGGSTQADVH
nr:hypothetical protein BaRGS_002951 [Batillaria attramentaria]